MSEAIQQADELRSRAIGLLLTERTAIDERLKLFGYDGTEPATRQTKARTCSKCGQEGHNAKGCPSSTTPPA